MELYREFIFLKDIVKDLPPIFERFYGDERHTTCPKCGADNKNDAQG
jgi:3-hydroxyanthranilate 3,4-dioxygenase